MQGFINLGRNFFFLILCRHCDLIGHLTCRSKAKVPNESPVMTFYLKLIYVINYLN